MKKFKMFALAALLVAGVGAAGAQANFGAADQAIPGPGCGGCWPD
ncbi:hypothetical protein [Indioceanicola profundi]|nr:hypothetical protein [Indioceanicola profundi]